MAQSHNIKRKNYPIDGFLDSIETKKRMLPMTEIRVPVINMVFKLDWVSKKPPIKLPPTPPNVMAAVVKA